MTAAPEVDRLCDEARQDLRSRAFERAINRLEQAVELDQDNASVHELLGTANFLAGNYENAAAHFIKVNRLKPRDANAFINLGAVYNRSGEYQKAIEALRKGLQIDRRSAAAYYNLGIAQRKLNQFGLAIPAYREAIRLEPQMAEAHQNLGNVYMEMGNHQQAIMHFKKALEINPKFQRALRALEAAETSRSDARANRNPFGRLVDTAEISGTGKKVNYRELSEEDRFHDRKALQKHAFELNRHVRECLELVRSQLDPSLRNLNRAVIQETAAAGGLAISQEQFVPITKSFTRLTAQMKQAMQELRDYEAGLRE